LFAFRAPFYTLSIALPRVPKCRGDHSDTHRTKIQPQIQTQAEPQSFSSFFSSLLSLLARSLGGASHHPLHPSSLQLMDLPTLPRERRARFVSRRALAELIKVKEREGEKGKNKKQGQKEEKEKKKNSTLTTSTSTST